MLSESILTAQYALNGYLRTAAEINPGLKARFDEYMAALEIVPQVKALPDPQIAFGYFIQPVETRVGPQQFKISASQMFPWIGTLKAKENFAIQSAKVKLEVFVEAISMLFNEIRSTYFNTYFNHKAIEITMENIDILNTFRKLANIKFESGLVSAIDEYRSEIEIGELENHLALLKDQQKVLEVMYNNFLKTANNNPVVNPELECDEAFPAR